METLKKERFQVRKDIPESLVPLVAGSRLCQSLTVPHLSVYGYGPESIVKYYYDMSLESHAFNRRHTPT